MPRGDGRRWETFNVRQQYDRYSQALSFVPWGYYLTRARAGLAVGAIHHVCAMERLGTTELPTTGGRRLRNINGITTLHRMRQGERCISCHSLLVNRVGNYRLRVVPTPPVIGHDIFRGCSPRDRDRRWRITVPAGLNIEPVECNGFLVALTAMRAAMPAGWELRDARYSMDITQPDLRLLIVDNAIYDGLDGTAGQRVRVAQLRQRLEENRRSLINYETEVELLQQRIATAVVDLERQASSPGEMHSRQRLAEFLGTIPAIRDWVLTNGKLTLNLWPIKLHNAGTGLSVVTTPHTWVVAPSSRDGFTLEVSGAHPHWSGRRYCAGDHASQMQGLLARGQIMQAIRFLLELRRGWNEEDRWATPQHVTESSFMAFNRTPAEYEYIQDGMSGEVVPFVDPNAVMIGRRPR